MKLDFETNTHVISSIDDEFYNDTDFEKSSSEVLPMLRAGINAAQNGKRAEAKVLLLRVTEIEPGNEDAWMRLASVSEYPEELLGFLAHVLEINPHNERALEWEKSTKALLSKTMVERGMNSSKDGRKELAKQCFSQAVALDDENETAWLWLASAAESAEQKTAFLKKVLSLNPHNENAKFLLKSIKNYQVDQLLQEAVVTAVVGEANTAKQMLDKILRDTPDLVEAWVLKSFLVSSFEEKIDCYERILDLDDENELANVSWTALLDVMSKAESPTRADAADRAEQFSAGETEDFEEPATNFDSQSMNDNFQQDTVSKDVFVAAEQTEALSNDETKDFSDETFSTQFSSNEEDIAGSEFEEVEVFEEETDANEVEYSQPVTDFLPEFKEDDYSLYADEKVSPESNETPSYFVSEEAAVSAPETVETDYSQKFTNVAERNFDSAFADESESSQTVVEDAVEKEEKEEEETLQENVAEASAADSDTSNSFEENYNDSANTTAACPFCSAEEKEQSFVCGSCHTMLTLSDLEMLLAHGEADREILRQAVERMEEERNRRDFTVEELKLLAIGQINLKNLRQGCAYLYEASQMNPNDVVLSSKLNTLKIRLAEIEEQQSVHETMPRNRKILVVDDSATVRKLISGKLEKSGHEVFCAVDGLDAMEKIAEIVPDLILLDINMPRMDGYQVCKLIRANETTKDVPVVMISGKDGFFDKVRGRMAGTTGYITKPFGPETLMKMVETYII